MELDPVLLSRVQFAIGGGVITYTANGAQKVAVAAGFTMLCLAYEDREGQGRGAGPRQRLHETGRRLMPPRIFSISLRSNVGPASEADRRLLSHCVAAACLRCSP